MKKYNVTEVFVPGGMPQLTYISRNDKSLEEALLSAQNNLCKLVTVTGPTKSGKTVLVSRVYGEANSIWIDGGTVSSEEDFWSFILYSLEEYTDTSQKTVESSQSEVSGGVKGGISAIFLKGEGNANTKLSKNRGSESARSVSLTSRVAAINALKKKKVPIIVDDFHYLQKTVQTQIVQALKSVIFAGLPVIIIAIPHRRFDVIRVEKEMTARVYQLRIPEWEQNELIEIPKEGFRLLNLSSSNDAYKYLAREAHGSPHLMQEFCRSWTEENNIGRTVRNSKELIFPSRNIFTNVAKSTGKYIFEKLATNTGNKSNRIQRPLKTGGVADLYEVILLSLSDVANGTGAIRYDELRSSIKNVLVDKIPNKSEIVRVLGKLSNVAAVDNASSPVLEWDKEDSCLHITDPFFAFFLKYGLTRENQRQMDPVFTDDEPLGSLVAERYEDKHFERIFDTDNQIYKALQTGPTVLIGRKGSGKTSLLKSISVLDSRCLTINLEAPKLYTETLRRKKQLDSPLFVEDIAILWEMVIWKYVFKAIVKKLPLNESKHLSLIKDYLSCESGNSDNKDDSMFQGKCISLFEDAKEEATNLLSSNNKCIVVLVDSMESFELSNKEFSALFSGFVKFAGGTGMRNKHIQMRYAIPSELYHNIMAVSSNPIKDFNRTLRLDWTASELLQMAAKRYSEYLAIHEPEYYESILSKYNYKGRKKASTLWNIMFPEEIRSKFNVSEKPMAYILRHTQLTPRHLIYLINGIIRKGRKAGEIRYGFSASQIIDSIENDQYVLVKEIFSSYKNVYPYAQQVCEQCIPDLNDVFSIGDMERNFRIHGKRAMATDDFFEFKRMLIEIGAVGRVIDITGKYVQGVFEYTVPHQLVTSTDDQLCLHPLFSEVFHSKSKLNKPVYPYGSVTSDRDYREWN